MSAKDNAAVEMTEVKMTAVKMTEVEKTEVKKTESEMKNRSMVLWAILSLSMANALVGTGISPALGVIRQNFPDAPGVLVQMIVSLPSLMVIAVAIPFAWLSRRYSVRKLCAAGLVLFLAGGLMGGLASGIYTLVLTRILIGAGYVMGDHVFQLLSFLHQGGTAPLKWRHCHLVQCLIHHMHGAGRVPGCHILAGGVSGVSVWNTMSVAVP